MGPAPVGGSPAAGPGIASHVRLWGVAVGGEASLSVVRADCASIAPVLRGGGAVSGFEDAVEEGVQVAHRADDAGGAVDRFVQVAAYR